MVELNFLTVFADKREQINRLSRYINIAILRIIMNEFETKRDNKRRVLLCGLYRRDYDLSEIIKFLKDYSGQVWVMNDWYQCINMKLSPRLIWNLHKYPHVHAIDKSRFKDWRDQYLRCVEAGARIMTCYNIDSMPGQIRLELDALRNIAPKFLSCTMSTMIIQAIYEQMSHIDIIGVKLNSVEYSYEYLGISGAIALARDKGISVNVLPSGREEKWASRAKDVNWDKLGEQCFKEYWEREASGTIGVKIDSDIITTVTLNGR